MNHEARRLRLAGFAVHVQLAWDDGENLTPGPQTQPMLLTLEDLRELVETWPEKFAALTLQAGTPAA